MTNTSAPERPIGAKSGRADTFSRFVCWEPERVVQIMDTEALQPSSEVFLATHSSLPMFRADLSAGDALHDYDENAFLRDFLTPADYAFVAVLGGAGTGKSHLIRWLSTRVRATSARRVLLIPRAGTSLHEVLRRILEGIEGERFDEYRRRLRESSTAMSLAEARMRLLDNLAVAIGAVGQTEEGARTDEEDYLASDLPNLLRDPVFRPHFLQSGGVIDRLAIHVIGGGGVERIEERRAFSVSDLPLRFQDVKRASAPAQSIHRDLIANQTLQNAAARWLTRHLDEAVTQLMRLSGTDLLQLMIDVRIELGRQGTELVLLIEDLATLQGIDQQLLEALIIRPRQPDMPPLCALRTAVAMTSGYYDGLRKNVHQRFDFRVVMGNRDARGHASAAEVEAFTARYLNATRLHASELDEWFGRSNESGDVESIPSACSRCQFRGECHRTFGAHDGMGLYPLSAVAIAGIAERVSPDGFNPRTQLKEGYKPILENYAGSLANGDFPPPELIERLGGLKLRPIVVTQIRRQDPTDHARREVLLDLWANAQEAINLDPVIHQAFDIPMLGGISTLKPDVDTRRPTLSGPETRSDTTEVALSATESRLQEQLRALDVWSNGGSMSQDLMQDLRELVYASVLNHIDWNSLHLIQGEFSGGKGFRQRNSINFARQILPTARGQIMLPIPLHDTDLAEAALALQALLRYKAHRSWRFEEGSRYYRAYLRQVSAWSARVIEQVNDLREGGKSWDPVPACTELLAIGARVMGRPRSRDPERADLVDAIFAAPSERDDSDRSEEWQKLVKAVRRHHVKAQEVVRARIACSKGDSRRIQIVDASRVLPTLAETRRSFRPSEEIPSDLERSWGFIRDYQAELVDLLDKAVPAERENQLTKYDAVAQHIGLEPELPETASAHRRMTVDALRKTLEAAANAGVLAGVNKALFEEKLEEFEGVQLQAWAESIQRVREEEDRARLIAELSLVPSNAARVSGDLVEAADRMLSRTESAVQNEMKEHELDGTAELQRVQDAIEEKLRWLEKSLVSLSNSEGE